MPTTALGITYPSGTDNIDIPGDMQQLATDVNGLITTDRTARDAAYTAFTPTMAAQSGGSPALGNATVTARYAQQGKRVSGMISVSVGSTTSFGSGITYWALPVLNHSGWNSHHIGTCYMLDTSATSRKLGYLLLDGANQRFLIEQYDGTIITSTVPWTWATGDQIKAVFNYEAS